MKKIRKKQPNLILIMIDDLRAKNLSCYGYKKTTSPNIDKIAEKGALFLNAFCTLNATDPSMTSMMTGKLPVNHGIINHGIRVTPKEENYLRNSGIHFLPEMLQDAGYKTYALDWLSKWHREGFDYYMGIQEKNSIANKILDNLKKSLKRLARGIEKYPFIYNMLRSLYREKLFENAKEVTDKAIQIIDRNKSRNEKPFFLFIHYWDTHAPYQTYEWLIDKFYSEDEKIELTPDEMLKKIGDINMKNTVKSLFGRRRNIYEILAKYESCIYFIDSNIGRLMKKLEKTKELNNTIIIITSDHGESLLQHEIFFDHHGLYDDAINIPLIIYDLRKDFKIRNNSLVQNIDLAPTIIDLLKLEVKDEFDGQSLVPLINKTKKEIHPYLFIEEAHTERKRAIRTMKYKYIQVADSKRSICEYCRRMHGDKEELYDLEKDPEEKENIIKKEPKVANSLKKKIIEITKKGKSKKSGSLEKERIKVQRAIDEINKKIRI